MIQFIPMKKVMKIASKIENLRLVEKFVDEISTELSLSDEIYGNIMIATLEAANNAIVHGNALQENLMVEINIENEKDILLVVISDQGKGFDYLHVPDPTAPENIEKINGRGVFLMQKLSDGLEFLSNGSMVRLKFNTKF